MKQVCYRKIKSGAFAGDVFALFPEYRNGEVSCFDPVGGFGSMSLEYFTDCTEDATPEESATVREVWESLYNGFRDIQYPDAGLEEISFSDFMRIIFPDDGKRIFYCLPCDQYGQPSGQIEKYRMTPGEYVVEKRYEEENHLAMWFDTYESALNRADD